MERPSPKFSSDQCRISSADRYSRWLFCCQLSDVFLLPRLWRGVANRLLSCSGAVTVQFPCLIPVVGGENDCIPPRQLQAHWCYDFVGSGHPKRASTVDAYTQHCGGGSFYWCKKKKAGFNNNRGNNKGYRWYTSSEERWGRCCGYYGRFRQTIEADVLIDTFGFAFPCTPADACEFATWPLAWCSKQTDKQSPGKFYEVPPGYKATTAHLALPQLF